MAGLVCGCWNEVWFAAQISKINTGENKQTRAGHERRSIQLSQRESHFS